MKAIINWLRTEIPLSLWLGLWVGIGALLIEPFRPIGIGLMIICLLYCHSDGRQRTRNALTTARKLKSETQARHTLQPEGPSFQEVLRALPDPVLVVSGTVPSDKSSRKIVFANHAAREVLRIDSEGRSLVSAIRNPEVLDCVEDSLWNGASKIVNFVAANRGLDHYWRAQSVPLDTKDTREKLALLWLSDETEFHRLEQMRADFLANASHELKSPLASLTGCIDTLKGHARNDPEAQKRFLDIMGRQAERMRALIFDLLSLSRIEMNEHIAPSGKIDMLMTLKDVMDGLSLQASQKNLRFEFIKPIVTEPLMITGDRDQVHQVLQNLIDNAIKYSKPDQTIRIKIKANQSLQDINQSERDVPRLFIIKPTHLSEGRYLGIEVQDFGDGIHRSYLPRLAERFYRIEGQKSGEGLGTGLGLAIVKHILSRHRGGLLVESVTSQPLQDGLSDLPQQMGIRPLQKPTDPAEFPLQSFTRFTAYWLQNGSFNIDDSREDQEEAPKIQNLVTMDRPAIINLSS